MMSLQRSRDIAEQAIADYQPYAVVAMVSGGDDSLTALTVARFLGVRIHYILHGITGTGVQSTTDHVRQIAQGFEAQYIEANAGDAYEQYVTRKGFYGVGNIAHTYAYHTLKHQQFRAAISRHIRHRKRGRNVLLLNGARSSESGNRKGKMASGPIRAEGPNVWVSLIQDWSKRDCLDFLKQESMPRCQAAIYCHRSAECMCGTMQKKDAAEEVAFFFPEWGKWWRDIRGRVAPAFGWDWGEDVPEVFKARKAREKALAAGQRDLFDDWLPMCTSCQSEYSFR